jgi:hypothetical protein
MGVTMATGPPPNGGSSGRYTAGRRQAGVTTTRSPRTVEGVAVSCESLGDGGAGLLGSRCRITATVPGKESDGARARKAAPAATLPSSCTPIGGWRRLLVSSTPGLLVGSRPGCGADRLSSESIDGWLGSGYSWYARSSSHVLPPAVERDHVSSMLIYARTYLGRACAGYEAGWGQ